MAPWTDLSYLCRGTSRQRAAYHAIEKLGILQKLSAYSPTLVSTICIDIDVPGSDLDIICQYSAREEFIVQVRNHFSSMPEYHEDNSPDGPVVVEFLFSDFLFEIYGDTQAPENQYAYRHLSVMKRLLDIGPTRLKEEVRQLKSQGIKSEAAFAQCLGLSGNDPFAAILALEKCSDRELEDFLSPARSVDFEKS
jgi:hypothetical protein